jgi:hypothetical protein
MRAITVRCDHCRVDVVTYETVILIHAGPRRQPCPSARRAVAKRWPKVLQTGAGSNVKTRAARGSRSISDLSSLHFPYDSGSLPCDLAVVVNAWQTLPEPLKAGILAMIQTVTGKENRQ